jgi:hypothetical protein
MPLPATVSPARSGKPFSRLETKKRDFPKSNVGKLNSVKPGIVQMARGGELAGYFAEKEGAYLMLKENLPGALVANPIGRKTHVSTPKRYRVCHNSDKVCQNEGWKLAQKARPSHLGSAEKLLF